MKYYLKILLHIWIFLLISSFSIGQENLSDKPNILFIAIDDLNDWTGFMGGHPQAKTPNIDRLAKKGIAFTKAYSSAPLCNPARISLLTGILPSNSGVYGNAELNFRDRIPGVTTIMEYLKRFDYKTIGGGKIFHGFNTIGDSISWDYYHKITRASRIKGKIISNGKNKFDGRDSNLPFPSLFKTK